MSAALRRGGREAILHCEHAGGGILLFARIAHASLDSNMVAVHRCQRGWGMFLRISGMLWYFFYKKYQGKCYENHYAERSHAKKAPTKG